MEPSISVALDLLRLVAAALVFVHHFEEVTHSALASPFASFGHDSVLFFFVLSGFVIAHVATTTERSASQFAIARVSRLYSVGLPALVLTATLVAIGSLTDLPGRALLSQADWPRIMAASLLFLNESFTSRIEVPTNVPYWSVCYEAWYYVIFALAWYGRGWPRAVLLGLAALAAGLKVLILFPIWLAGVLVYRTMHRIRLSNLAAASILATCSVGYAVIRAGNLDDRLAKLSATTLFGSIEVANATLGYSSRFVPDYLIGSMIVAVVVAAIHGRGAIAPWLVRGEGAIRALAGSSFSLYLYHYPLLLFLAAAGLSPLANFVATLTAVALLARITEHRKQAWRRVAAFLIRGRSPGAGATGG